MTFTTLRNIFSSLSHKSVVRPYPYPYQAALSISSDPDMSDFEFFEEFYKFLNTKKITKYGHGLDLEVTAGLFFFTANPYNFSYYNLQNSKKKSPYADRLDDYLRSGWIDTNHAYGDFDNVGGFRREHAEATLLATKNLSAELPIYTNHGDANNIQNIGKKYPHYLGDKKDEDAYHIDILTKIGTQFLWSQDLVEEYDITSGDILQDSPLKEECPSFVGFRRFRGTGCHAPNLSSLNYQLSLIDFDKTYQEKKAIMIYQHLGVLVRYALHCVSASQENVLHNRHILSGLYKLKEEREKGKLWVVGVFRLLNYLRMLQSITVQEVSFNSFSIKSAQNIDIRGLTIYADTSNQVYIEHNGVPVKYLQYNGLDETGCYSVSIPFHRLDDIW